MRKATGNRKPALQLDPKVNFVTHYVAIKIQTNAQNVAKLDYVLRQRAITYLLRLSKGGLSVFTFLLEFVL
jgi:hypothetical protein